MVDAEASSFGCAEGTPQVVYAIDHEMVRFLTLRNSLQC
jgi:hypothetical protein